MDEQEPVNGVIREDNYYGGDLNVRLRDDFDVIDIEWQAWGGHGGATITVRPGEARLIATALERLADSVDPDHDY